MTVKWINKKLLLIILCLSLLSNSVLVTAATTKGPIIVVDAGHQGRGNSNLEQNSPYTKVLKKKVTAGTTGIASKEPEHKLTLLIAKQVRQELIKRGYQVVMIRSTANVDISNKQRALIANRHKADAFIRIHANGSENSSKHGALTIYPSIDAVNSSSIAKRSKDLSQCLLASYVKRTNFYNRGVYERSDLSGCNWSKVPVSVIEMGYMTNAKEDLKMQSSTYQKKMVLGICDGIDRFFKR